MMKELTLLQLHGSLSVHAWSSAGCLFVEDGGSVQHGT
jgi:hypothetical protein